MSAARPRYQGRGTGERISSAGDRVAPRASRVGVLIPDSVASRVRKARDFYGPSLVVINMGDVFNTGPDETAFAVRKLLTPLTAIPCHTDEASTTGGAVTPGRGSSSSSHRSGAPRRSSSLERDTAVLRRPRQRRELAVSCSFAE